MLMKTCSNKYRLFSQVVTIAALIFAGCLKEALALPKQPVINGGQASIVMGTNSMTVQQKTDKVSINYQGFDIAAHEQVNFQQPSSSSIALNRVEGNNPSNIFGVLQSNGQVFLVNPNGIVFGPGSYVNVGGLVASTLNVNDDDFFNGQFHFSGESIGNITNEGLIEAAQNGMLAFISREVINNGEMRAPQGQIELHAGSDFMLDFTGEAVSIKSNDAVVGALIENHGLIQAEGGHIVLNAHARDALEQTVVNNTGIIRATRIAEQNGEIYILGSEGDIILDGELNADASGNVDGGAIDVNANRVAAIGNMSANGDQLGGGNIHLNADNTILLADGANITANAGIAGGGGEIIAYSPEMAIFKEGVKLEAKGGSESGNGGFIEVSGLAKVEIFGHVDTSAANGEAGTFYIDPYDITISSALSADGAFDAADPNSWEGSGVGATSTINTGAITAALAVSDVIINTALDDGSGPGTGTGNITVANNIDLEGGSGNSLSLIANNDILLANNVKIQDFSTGTVDVVNVNLTAGNDISFGNDSDIVTTGGNVTINAVGALNTQSNSSIEVGAGLIDITANDVRLGGVLISNSVADNAITVASNAQIADSGAPSVDLDASNGGIILSASTGINVDVDAAKLSVTNSTSGNVVIDEDNSVELANLSFQGGDVTISTLNGGDFDLTANVDLDGLNGSTITFASAGDLDIVKDYLMEDSNIVTADAVNINLSAGNNLIARIRGRINSSGGDITINAGNQFDPRVSTAFNSDAGQISVVANDVTFISKLISSSTLSNAITVVSGTTITDAGAPLIDIQAQNGGVVLQAVNGIDIDTWTGSLSVNNSTSGAIIIDETDGLELTSLTAAGSTSITANGALTIPDAGLNVGANALSLTATDILDVSGRTLDLTAGALTLDTQSTGGDAIFDTSVLSLSLTNNGSNQISVNETDDLNLVNIVMGNGNLTVNAGSDLNVLNNIELEGIVGKTLTLNAANDLVISKNISDTVGAVDNNTEIRLDAGNSIDMLAGTEVNAGAGRILLSAVGGNANIGRLVTTNTAADALTVTSGGQVTDRYTGSNLVAQEGGALISAVTGINDGTNGFGTDVKELSISNTGNGEVRIEEVDDIQVMALDVTGSSSLTEVESLGGSIVLPSSVNTVNTLHLIAANDINDGDRSLSFTSMDALSLEVGAAEGDLVINTSVDSFQALLGGSANLQVTNANDFVMRDIAGQGAAVQLASGTLTVSTNSGDLTISDDVIINQGNINLASNGSMFIDAAVSATDGLGDGVREGLVDIAVNGGDFNLGAMRSASIVSNNQVDQSVGGGLGGLDKEQVAIRIRQLASDTNNYQFVLGDGNLSDTLVSAIGGDVFMDSLGGIDPALASNRPLILNRDVRMEALNRVEDAPIGSVSIENVINNGAVLEASSGRSIQLNTSNVSAPIYATTDEINEELSGILTDMAPFTGNYTPTNGTTPSILTMVQSDKQQVSNIFSRAFGGGCEGDSDQRDSKACKTERTLVGFLNAFIIGGELPGGER